MEIVLIGITLVSLGLAGVMSFIAWRVVRQERLRSNARVASLAAEIQSDFGQEGLERQERREGEGGRVPKSSTLPAAPAAAARPALDMFACLQPKAALPRLMAVVAAGAVVFVSAAALLVALGRNGRVEAHATPNAAPMLSAAEPQAHAAAPQPSRPLELVALGHERERDKLVVRGVIRNPANGPAVRQLTAVVMLFNREGGFLATGRGDVQPASLDPGGETTFLVTVPGGAGVGRYRVSFRSDERVIPHVDVRN